MLLNSGKTASADGSFGVARAMTDFGLSVRQCEVKDGLFETLCWRDSYLAPELVRGEYTEKVDTSLFVSLSSYSVCSFPFTLSSSPKPANESLH